MLIWQDLFAAIALVLVFEGMVPFIKPHTWKKLMGIIAKKDDASIRTIGLTSMLFGVGLLYIVR